MPKHTAGSTTFTRRRVTPDGLADGLAAEIKAAVTAFADQLPDTLAADHTDTAAGPADPVGGTGNREQRRARTKAQRRLWKAIERRNRHQLLPHYITGAVLLLGELIHQANLHAGGYLAALVGLTTLTGGAVGYWLLRRRRQILDGWQAWSGLLGLAAAAWMTLVVSTGLTWGAATLALGIDYAFGARWWARHRHPEPVAPQPHAEAESEPQMPVEVDESQIALYPRRWARYLGGKGCVLDGSSLIDGEPFDNGIQYVLQLHPGKQDIDMVLAAMSKIASGLRHPETALTAELLDGDDPSLVRFRVVTASPVKNHVFFRGPEIVKGRIILGPYADGVGTATWRLHSSNSWWGGMVIGGIGSGKSRLIEVIALNALYSRLAYVIHVDGQDGSSCPSLWKHAQERYASTDVEEVLVRIAAMQQYRQDLRREQGETSDDAAHGFTPSEDFPGILVVVDEAHAVIDKTNIDAWATIAREARKVGIAEIMGDQDASLETFIKTVLRGSLRAGNAVGLRTEERTQGQIAGNGRFNLADLPPIPGYGHTLGNDSRHAPMRAQWLPSRNDAREAADNGTPFPTDLLMVEDWYEKAPKIALDHGTLQAGDQAVAQWRKTREDTAPTAARRTVSPSTTARPLPRLTPIPFPTVGSPAQVVESAPASRAALLTDPQRRVFNAVRDGHAQPGEIASELGLSRQRVGQILGELMDKNLITKTGAGPSVRYETAA